MRTTSDPQFHGNGVITFEAKSIPEPGPGELVIRVLANAICGTDRNLYLAGSAVTPGHEASGEVYAAGSNTTTPVGTRGVIYFIAFCGACRSCKIGATNQCLSRVADIGFDRDGGYGSFELVPESSFFPVPDAIEIGAATLLLDVLGTSGHALSRALLIRQDIESVLITGAGPVGLGLLLTCRARLGTHVPVYISDVSPWRRDLAASLGGLPIDPNSARGLLEAGHPDAVFEASGKESARKAGFDQLSNRGVLVCVGHGEGLTVDIVQDLLYPERAILGSEYFRFDEFPAALDLLTAHHDEMTRLITHRFDVSDIREAFETFIAGRSGKVLVTHECGVAP